MQPFLFNYLGLLSLLVTPLKMKLLMSNAMAPLFYVLASCRWFSSVRRVEPSHSRSSTPYTATTSFFSTHTRDFLLSCFDIPWL